MREQPDFCSANGDAVLTLRAVNVVATSSVVVDSVVVPAAYTHDHQALLKAKYCPRVAAA